MIFHKTGLALSSTSSEQMFFLSSLSSHKNREMGIWPLANMGAGTVLSMVLKRVTNMAW